MATLPEEKSRILAVLRKTSPLLFTVIQKHYELRAGMENIPSSGGIIILYAVCLKQKGDSGKGSIYVLFQAKYC
jgi:hypothetical protein